MRTTARLVRLGLPILLIAGASGCALLVAGVAGGTAAYAMGDLESELEASPQKIVGAAARVLEDMEMRDVQSSATSIDGEVSARSLDRNVTVKVKHKTETISKVSIRVGPFGDESLSREILEKIKGRL